MVQQPLGIGKNPLNGSVSSLGVSEGCFTLGVQVSMGRWRLIKRLSKQQVMDVGEKVSKFEWVIHDSTGRESTIKWIGAKRVSEHVFSLDDGYWTHFQRHPLPASYRELIEALKVTGKYLFFSEDRARLVEIAIEELEGNGFREAKINDEGENIGPEYVLCLYYKDDGRKHELARKYAKMSGVKYRYWKSDSDTREGKYSAKFLSKLAPSQRDAFTKSE